MTARALTSIYIQYVIGPMIYESHVWACVIFSYHWIIYDKRLVLDKAFDWRCHHRI